MDFLDYPFEAMVSKLEQYVKHQGIQPGRLEATRCTYEKFFIIDSLTGEILLTVKGESIHFKEWNSFVKLLKKKY